MPLHKTLPFLLVLSAGLLVSAGNQEADYPIDAKLEGPASPYTDVIIKLAKRWPEGRKECKFKKEPNQIQMVKIPTEDRPYYIGFRKCMGIKASFAAVTSVIEDFGHYQELFPGDKTVKIAERDRNKVTLAWERKIPVFFVPNVHYQTNHIAVPMGPGIKMYRMQFKGGERLKTSDALVVVEAQGPNFTLYTDYEFYEADYALGLLGLQAVGTDEAWKESIQGSYLSLMALRMKAEKPEMSYEEISKATEESFKATDVTHLATGKLFENETK